MKRRAAKKTLPIRPKTEIYVGLKPVSAPKVALSNSRAVRFYEKIKADAWLPITNVVAIKAGPSGSMEIKVKLTTKDRGQAHLRAALDGIDNYPFKIVFHDEGPPAINFFTGVLMSATVSTHGDAGTFLVVINSAIAEAEGVAR